jgi:hypothetical protein
MLPRPPRARSVFADPSLWLLVLSNAVTIWFALKENWSAPTLMWIYLFQGALIGFFHYVRILQLKHFVTDGLKMNNVPVPPTTQVKRQIAFFFLFHFGAFNGFGAVIIYQLYGGLDRLSPDELLAIAGTVGLFFVNHLFSFLYNRTKETKTQNLGTFSFYPYIRILPMYAMMWLVPHGFLAFPVFLVGKTIADALTHMAEHAMFRKGSKTITT